MPRCIEKLIEISGVAQCDRPPGGLEGYGGERFAELLNMCRLRNGLFAFESALHMYPVASHCDSMTFQVWNAAQTWKYAYDQMVDNILFFAEDIFGDQFGISGDAVIVFRSETAEIEVVAASIEEWACKILIDYESLTGYPIAHEWQKVHGPIANGMRLTGKRPFVLGGGYDLPNLYAADIVTIMRLRGDIYRQIRHLPDGAQLKVKVEW